MAEQQQGRPVIERLQDRPRSGRPAQFTPAQVAHIKAVACEQPARLELPLVVHTPTHARRARANMG